MGTEIVRKDTNPKDGVGIRKVSLSYLPCPVLMEMALGLMEGGCKYGSHNYRFAGVRAKIYYDAAMRHLMDWWEGQDIDPGSGLNHIIKCMTTLTVLRDAMINNKWVDDRPIKVVNPNWLEGFNKIAGEILDKFPNPELPYTEIPLNPNQFKVEDE